MHFLEVASFIASIVALRQIVKADSTDSISISFCTGCSCEEVYILTRTVAVNECFALADKQHLVRLLSGTSLIPESPRQELLEAGDTNPIDCDAGRCVLLSEDLGCQPALSDGETAWWFGMFGDL